MLLGPRAGPRQVRQFRRRIGFDYRRGRRGCQGRKTSQGRRSAQSAIAPCRASSCPVEEVVGAGEDDELARRRKRLHQDAQRLAGAELVPLALDEETRLADLAERGPSLVAGQGTRPRESVVHHPEGKPEGEDGADPRVAGGHAERDRRAEGEAAEDEGQAREAVFHLEERGPRVLLLARAVVVCPLAAADAPEVEAEDGEAGRLQRLRGAEDDLEVHHPAVERVRVADDRRGHGRPLGAHQDRLEAAGGPAEVEGLVGRHGTGLRRAASSRRAAGATSRRG